MVQNARNVKLHGLENTNALSYGPFGNYFSYYSCGGPFHYAQPQPQFPLYTYYSTGIYGPDYSYVQAPPPPIGQTYAPPF